MKTLTNPCIIAVFLLAISSASSAVVIDEVVTSNTTIAARSALVSGDSVKYHINDGVTMTFTGSPAATGGAFSLAASTTLSIAPNNAESLGTGKVVFNIANTTHGGAINIAGGNLSLTNVEFRNNSIPANVVAGAINIANNAAATVTLNNVMFEGNSAGSSGAIRNRGGASTTFTMLGGGFKDNYVIGAAAIGVGGAFEQNNAATSILENVNFERNRAGYRSGAMHASAGVLSLKDVHFTSNWAGLQGGAIYLGTTLGLQVTATGGDAGVHVIEGNFAQNAADTTAAVTSGTASGSAVAKAGGFLFFNTAGILNLTVDQGAKLLIGSATATNSAYDTIASAATTPKLEKLGGGTLVLHADNAYFQGTTTVTDGRLLLGGTNARLGGTIVTGSGATFGGVGTIISFDQSDTALLASVSASAGSTLQVGSGELDGGTLRIEGDLTLADSTLSFLAFAGTANALLGVTGNFAVSGSNTLNMQAFSTGTYYLGEIASFITDSSTVSFSVNGDITVAGSRQGATQVTGTGASDLWVSVWTSQAQTMRWTGTSGNTWNTSDDSWEGVNNPLVTKFASGDMVEFSNSAEGDVSINVANNVTVTGMLVGGTNSLTFTGPGAITGNPYTSGDAEAAVQEGIGKLVKNGTGALIFQNAGNLFNGGIELNDGLLVFSNGNQIQTSGTAIVFGSGTLQAASNTSITNNIITSVDKVATIDTGANTLTQAGGMITGAGILAKKGTGTLILNSVNDHAGTQLAAGTIEVTNANALGPGPLTVTGGGVSLVAGNGLTIANPMDVASYGLTVVHKGGAAVSLVGTLHGTGVLHLSRGPDINSAAFTLSGNNNLAGLAINNGISATAAGTGALGGMNSHVSVNSGGTLTIELPDTVAGHLNLKTGGKTIFRNLSETGTLLQLSSSASLEASSTIAIDQSVSTGQYRLISATGGVQDAGVVFDKGPNTDAIIDISANTVDITLVNLAADLGKDAAAAFDAMRASLDAVYSRMSEGFLLPVMDRDVSDPINNLWVKGVASYGDHKDGAHRLGHSDTTYGILTGFDRILGGHLLLGGYFGCSNVKIETDNDAKTDTDLIYGGLYTAAQLGTLYVSADFTMGAIDANTTRFEGIGYAKGEYSGRMIGSGVETGFVLHTLEDTAIKPSIGLHYMHMKFKDYKEQGPGSLLIDDFSEYSLSSLMSIRATQKFRTAWGGVGMLDLTAGWRSQLNTKRLSIDGALASVPNHKIVFDGNIPSKHLGVLGVGIRVGISKHIIFSFSYDYEFSTTYDRHSLISSIRWTW